MVHIVNSSQQITHAVLAPQGFHSRVVNLATFVAAGFGQLGFEVTSPLGDTIRLLQVRLFIMPGVVDGFADVIFHLSTGTGKIADFTTLANIWDKVITNTGTNEPAIRYKGVQRDFVWDMNRLYLGNGRRFGFGIQNISTTIGITAWASFQISEG